MVQGLRRYGEKKVVTLQKAGVLAACAGTAAGEEEEPKQSGQNIIVCYPKKDDEGCDEVRAGEKEQL